MILLYTYLTVSLIVFILTLLLTRGSDGVIASVAFALLWPVIIGITCYVLGDEYIQAKREKCKNGHDYWPEEINGRHVMKCRRCGHIAYLD